MPIFPKLRVQATSRRMTDTFLGYNHNLKIADGEFYDTTNMTTEFYPLLANRRKRSIVASDKYMLGVLGGDKLAWIQTVLVEGDIVPEVWLFYDGEKVMKVADNVPSPSTFARRQLVHFGAYICVFPDGLYYNTADGTSGSMGVDWESTNFTVTLCDEYGFTYSQTPTHSAEAPENPSDKDIWIDYGDKLYIYSADESQWIEKKPYVSIHTEDDTTLDLPDLVKKGDFVNIETSENLTGIQGLKEIVKVERWGMGESYMGVAIVIPGVIYTAQTSYPTGTVSVFREVPDMDYVCEAQNRLWGCKYGMVDGEQINELYACALGDFTNWRKYTGISTDSWAASVGSPGVFTGAINYMGYPTFFKEDRVYRIAVSAKGAHQVTETMMNGVQDGSARSLTVMDNVLFYKAIDGVYAYQGGFPTKISDALGDVHYDKACGGCIGHRLYMSMMDKSFHRNIFVYDSDRRLWMREDGLAIVQFARSGSELYGITDGNSVTNELYVMYDDEHSAGTENDFQWSCETGIQYYEYPDHKYLSRYNIRMSMAKGAYMDIFFEYDSSGRWERAGKVRLAGTDTVTIPVRPRRCDHMRMKLSGIGDVRVYSIARILEEGSDV